MKYSKLFTTTALLAGLWSSIVRADDLDDAFANPSELAKPRVMWMWMGSNITREGITYDLEKLKDAGFGGAMMFALSDICTPWSAEIKNSPTPNVIAYKTDAWWQLVRHAAAESNRLNMDFGMGNCPGYETSGGPWITPDLSMQELVWTADATYLPEKKAYHIPRAKVDPRANQPFPFINPVTGAVEKPIVEERKTFYKDIAVLAVPADGVINKDKVINLTDKLKGDEVLWDAPDQTYKIYRFGYTTKGKIVQPAQWDAQGLECDKMNKEAVEFHMKHVLGDIKQHVGPYIGKGLTNLHFDSYEAGIPTWTPRMREEFQARRGYDMTPYLLVLAKRVVGSAQESKKFTDDVSRTVADLYRDIYYPTLRKMCNEAGLDLSSEPYGGPWQIGEVVPQLDRVLTEFWTTGNQFRPYNPRLESSAWKSGKNIIEAEAFTGSPDVSKWNETPASIKRTGDDAFICGVNRFMLHKYAQQAWGDAYKPGAVMGQWGTHFSPNQTWWEPGKAWIAYLSRCQALLQWGTIVVPDAADFKSDAKMLQGADKKSTFTIPSIRALHRRKGDVHVYFVANSLNEDITANCTFAVAGSQPELWNPVRGTKRDLPAYSSKDGATTINLKFAPAESYFIVFRKAATQTQVANAANFANLEPVTTLEGSWQVQFDPKWGGPAEPVQFDQLQDWTTRSEPGIKYFSGTAIYRKQFNAPDSAIKSATELDLGTVQHMARVKINGQDLGVVWTAPWSAAIPAGVLKAENNVLEIEVTNVWANRLIGDEQEPDDCKWVASPRNTGKYLAEFPEWVNKRQPRPSKGRFCFTPWNYFTKDSKLTPSGLLGPVRVMRESN